MITCCTIKNHMYHINFDFILKNLVIFQRFSSNEIFMFANSHICEKFLSIFNKLVNRLINNLNTIKVFYNESF